MQPVYGNALVYHKVADHRFEPSFAEPDVVGIVPCRIGASFDAAIYGLEESGGRFNAILRQGKLRFGGAGLNV